MRPPGDRRLRGRRVPSHREGVRRVAGARALSEPRSPRVPRQVLVYQFRDRGAVEFLLLKRTEQWGGFWQGVSGAPEWGESDVEGAVREVLEETGFEVVDTIEAIDDRYELRREDDLDGDRWEQLYGADVATIPEEVYVARVPGLADPILAPYEHDDFRWCSFEEAVGLLRWENNKHALLAARTYIESESPGSGPTP